jgi:hypothetical protein
MAIMYRVGTKQIGWGYSAAFYANIFSGQSDKDPIEAVVCVGDTLLSYSLDGVSTCIIDNETEQKYNWYQYIIMSGYSNRTPAQVIAHFKDVTPWKTRLFFI